MNSGRSKFVAAALYYAGKLAAMKIALSHASALRMVDLI